MVGVGAPVGAEGRRGIVGAATGAVGGPFFSAMVGAGAGGRGAPTVGAVGEMGGRTGAAIGTVAEGTAASDALRVTRTVSFLSGTREVFLDSNASLSVALSVTRTVSFLRLTLEVCFFGGVLLSLMGRFFWNDLTHKRFNFAPCQTSRWAELIKKEARSGGRMRSGQWPP